MPSTGDVPVQETSEALDLGAYLVALRRHWLMVLLPLVLTLAATAAVTYTQTPIYASTAEVALEPIRDSDELDLRDLILGTNVINTEVRVLTSNTVTERVIEALELDASPRRIADKVDVDLISNTRVVRITATDDDPAFAAALANTYATQYFEYRRDRALDEIVAARETLTERAANLREDIADVERQIRAAGLEIDGTVSADQSPLLVQRDTLLEQLAQVENQLAAIGTSADDLRGGGEILVPAEPSSDPIVPQPLRNLALAAVLGLTLGIALALLRDYLDDVVRVEADIRRAANGATIVGRIGTWDDEDADRKLITLVDPYAAASEEFQAMAANVRFALISRAGRHAAGGGEYAGRSIAVTSAAQTEGKTTIAGNLAVAAAGAGRRVILVDGDLRKPTLGKRFGLPKGVGLTDLLAEAQSAHGAQTINEYLLDVGVPRLRVLPSGSIPPNPTELLASARMAWLHGALEEMADLIVYDTPPLLPVADTLELSAHVDLTFVVVRAGSTHRRDLAHAIERLEGVGAELGGIMLNGLESTRGGYAYGGYGYGYRPQGEYRPQTDANDPSSSPSSFSAVRVRKVAPPPPEDSDSGSDARRDRRRDDDASRPAPRATRLADAPPPSSATSFEDAPPPTAATSLEDAPPPTAPAPPAPPTSTASGNGGGSGNGPATGNGSGSNGRDGARSGADEDAGTAEENDLDTWLFRNR